MPRIIREDLKKKFLWFCTNFLIIFSILYFYIYILNEIWWWKFAEGVRGFGDRRTGAAETKIFIWVVK